MNFNSKQENKVGINSFKLLDIEKEIVNLKLNLIDEYFTFNKETFDFEYLKELNNFLFSDLHLKKDLGTRKIKKQDVELINEYLKKIVYISIYKSENIEEILELTRKIWNLQPFKWGNTRTLFAYLKVLNYAFFLGLDININQEITSKESIFTLNNLVNQKRLTKNKKFDII